MIMRFLKNNLLYIYIALWMMYYLQEMLMIKGVVAQMVLVVLIAMSFYAFYEVNVHYKTCPYLKWLNVMLLVLTIYGIIPIIGGWTFIGNWQQESTRSHIYLQNIYKGLLPIYAFYFFSFKRQISEKNITLLFVVILVFCIISYYQKYVSVSEQSGKMEITNNIGYYFVPLIPMLHLLRIRDLWKYFFLIIIVGYLMMAMKRGAILTGMVMLLFFMYYHFKGISIKKALYISSLTIIVLFAVYKFTSNLFDNSTYFKKRVEDTRAGNTSQREKIYTTYFNYYIEKTTPLEFMIGNGANATIALFGQYAHNDWLEFALCQGVLGVVIYLVYWILFFMEWKNYRGPTNYRQTLQSIIVAYFLISLFSMSIDFMPIAATLCIGYCLAVNVRQRQIEAFRRGEIIRRDS